jgi:hypothetical protein
MTELSKHEISVAELVGVSYRTVFGCLLQIAFSIGFMAQPAVAYALRDEFRFQLVATAAHYIFPFITMYVLSALLLFLLVIDDETLLFYI